MDLNDPWVARAEVRRVARRFGLTEAEAARKVFGSK